MQELTFETILRLPQMDLKNIESRAEKQGLPCHR